jgi:putative transposase
MIKRNRKSIRWKGYNYSQSGLYFVSFCTKDRIEHFGDIQSEKMIFNRYGEIANKYWQEIPNHHNDVEIDEFVIMPNHIHGIVVICEEDVLSGGRDKACLVPTGSQQIERMHETLCNVIGSYKSVISKTIRKIGLPQFKWQRSYHDRVIRNSDELNRIRNYITNNPIIWHRDRNNPH